MADPTIKDVLKALAEMKAETTTRFDKLEAKVDAKADATEMREGFAAVRKDIAELDIDLDGHMKVHRELEKDIETLKKRPARTAARPTRAPRRR